MLIIYHNCQNHKITGKSIKLVRQVEIFISKRTMISSRCVYAARAAYHVASIISNSDIKDRNNTQPFISQIVDNSLDNTQGIPQHKATMWKHLSYQRLPGEYFYESFIDKVHLPNPVQLIKYEPHTLVDFRTTNELAVLHEYLKTFGHDILWTYSTLDAKASNFPKAQQTNVDFWVMIDKTLGLKATYQDEKAGMDMMRHATRGSVGILCYDEKGNNIQMTSQPITMNDLILNHRAKIEGLRNGLIHDGLFDKKDIDSPLSKMFDKANNIINDMKDKSFHESQNLHNDLQNLLWTQLQCNPTYNRSVSFIFIKQVINTPMTDKEYNFSQAFQSKLKDNYLYDLDKKGDIKELYNAFIYAGQKMDPHFVDKLYHLHNNGITLTQDVLLIMKEITKHAVH